MKNKKEKRKFEILSVKLSLLILFFLVLLVIFNLVFKHQFSKEKIKNFSIPLEERYNLVTEIVDGDTVVLENGDTIRYLGIDTPEQEECGNKEATDYNTQLVLNKRIKLLKDTTDKDNYGRLLRYVFLETGEFVNYLLVRNGFAQTLPIPPDTLFDKTFEDALKTAKKENLGIWGKCFREGGEKNESE